MQKIGSWISCSSLIPLHRENRENGPKKGKPKEFGNFAKTQGIWFAQVVNSLILKVNDISVFAAKISKFF